MSDSITNLRGLSKSCKDKIRLRFYQDYVPNAGYLIKYGTRVTGLCRVK